MLLGNANVSPHRENYAFSYDVESAFCNKHRGVHGMYGWYRVSVAEISSTMSRNNNHSKKGNISISSNNNSKSTGIYKEEIRQPMHLVVWWSGNIEEGRMVTFQPKFD
jgi:hypothetical protein